MNKLNEILKSALNKVKPSEEEMNEINGKSEELIKIIKEELKKIDIKTEVFVGGSFAKGTLIKKKNYDIDIFARFSGEVNSNFLEEALRKISNNIEKIHGSRDYFIIKDKNRVYEIVPVKMIKTPREAENSADLSYFHVNYVKGRIAKNKKLANDILLAKAFCYASGCYG
ncbi:MAG: nucleotidyltransferase domain-containing protein, partial [Nanoarchaeota archaeon]